ncbi:actin-like protein [Achlya hypogyna]|uniref:Actin-like protein n=1 Tax=Achlya hypogyna TaxID=1202772 RepID=A0A1V9ZK63_ACHHY|nr:actin-like protein [Achlya hypogyna]
MYCGGDELNAIVCDFGSYRARMGFAGEDAARYVGPHGSMKADDTNGIMTPAGHVGSIEALEAALDEGYDRLGVEASGHHPVLWSESSFHNVLSGGGGKNERETLAEIFFEKYDVPAYFVSKAAVLTCFANGRSTGLVVEFGHGSTAAVPVVEGYVQSHNAIRQPMGGRVLNAFLLSRLKEKLPKQDPMPISSLLLHDIKETVCRVSETLFDEKANSTIPQMPYELPDGTQVAFGTERFCVAERYFQYDAAAASRVNNTVEEPSLFVPSMIGESAAKGDADTKKELLQNIIVTGGSSCFENMATRLEREVTAMMQPYKVKVIAAAPPERKLGPFLGGSILGSLGSFHEMWISKTEYAEHGASLVQKKCP